MGLRVFQGSSSVFLVLDDSISLSTNDSRFPKSMKFSVHLMFSCNPSIRENAGLILSVVEANLRGLNLKLEDLVKKHFPEYAREAENDEELSQQKNDRPNYSTYFMFRFNANSETESALIERILKCAESVSE